jgi:type I restriction-modification system DNA methylase subunit
MVSVRTGPPTGGLRRGGHAGCYARAVNADAANAQAVALEKIRSLVHHHEGLVKSGEGRHYNEARTVNELILPLFGALGWDVHNSLGLGDVVPEDQVSRGRVDWAFRLGGVPKFFLEAKKLSADLDNPDFARQAINYSYNKGVTWAVLTDFEALRVYNAEWYGPNPNFGLFLDLSWEAYERDFDRLWWLSPESMERGVLDEEAAKVGKKLKKTPVGERLFSDMLTFRALLRDYLRAYNEAVSPDRIEHAVQRLLDRLIFIRALEDRAIEPNHLRSLMRGLEATNKRGQLWTGLLGVFREFDKGYDSQLFVRQLLDELETEVEPLRVVIEGLYGTRDRSVEYDFGAIDADVLGGVYEQYLGQLAKSPRVPKSKLSVSEALKRTARADTKPFRKAHGVYYTPRWVVRFIVAQTLGRFLVERQRDEVLHVRVLDPACGSGSFLIEAFRVLDEYWAALEPGNTTAQVRERRTRILKENIFGIDLDPQAVEIAQLNLMLIAVDSRDLLPDLTKNIVVGNSLIEREPAAKWFGAAPENAVEWKRISPEADGKFDVVIGNPPYIRAEGMDRAERDYFMGGGGFHPVGRFDIYALFMEMGLQRLREGGSFGYIIPAAFGTQNYGEWLRRQLLTTYRLDTLADLRDMDVFHGVGVEPAVVIASRAAPTDLVRIVKPSTRGDADRPDQWSVWEISAATFLGMPRAMFRLSYREAHDSLVAAFERFGITLGSICYCITGFVAHDSQTGASKNRLLTDDVTDPSARPYLEAKEVSESFGTLAPVRHIRYVPGEMHRPKFPQLFERPKLLVNRVVGRGGLRASVDRAGIYVNHSFDCVVRFADLTDAPPYARGTPEARELSASVSLDALAAVLNSSVMSGYFRLKHGTGMDASPANLRALPLPPLARLTEGSRLAELGKRMVGADEGHRPAQLEELNGVVLEAYEMESP